MKFILICATLGERLNEIKRLFDSIEIQNVESEVHLVHQGEVNRKEIKEICSKYSKVKYYNINFFGLSKARNYALKKIYRGKIKNNIVAFPDDDCYYYKGFLEKVKQIMYNKDFFICQYSEINEIDKLKLKKIPSHFLNRGPSVGIFYKPKSEMYFDNNLGIGSKITSCEDTDFCEKLRKNLNNGIFSSETLVYHLVPGKNSSISLERDIKANYAMGFYIRKVCKENNNYMIFFTKNIIKKTIGIIVGGYKGRKTYFLSLKFFIKGYIDGK